VRSAYFLLTDVSQNYPLTGIPTGTEILNIN